VHVRLEHVHGADLTGAGEVAHSYGHFALDQSNGLAGEWPESGVPDALPTGVTIVL
jgi:hypothetical protein